MDAATFDRLVRALAPRAEVELAVLFGSRAQGTFRADSDVDLAVRARGVDLLALGAQLSLELGLEVHIVALEDPGYPLLKELVANGVVVRGGAFGRAATWRAHALAELETDRPNFERMRDAFLARLARGESA